MYGLAVNLIMSVSGHSSIINEILEIKYNILSHLLFPQPEFQFANFLG